jgi:hypothetical protein
MKLRNQGIRAGSPAGRGQERPGGGGGAGAEDSSRGQQLLSKELILSQCSLAQRGPCVAYSAAYAGLHACVTLAVHQEIFLSGPDKPQLECSTVCASNAHALLTCELHGQAIGSDVYLGGSRGPHGVCRMRCGAPSAWSTSGCGQKTNMQTAWHVQHSLSNLQVLGAWVY